jgi:hypothetical protein
VHDGRQPEDGRQQMRNDPRGAAERREDAGPAALHQAGRDGKHDACPGNEDDDERGDQELDADQGEPFAAT